MQSEGRRGCGLLPWCSTSCRIHCVIVVWIHEHNLLVFVVKRSPRGPTFVTRRPPSSFLRTPPRRRRASPQGAPLETSGSCPVRHAPLHPAAARSACPRSSKRTSPRPAGSQVSDHFGGVNATSTRGNCATREVHRQVSVFSQTAFCCNLWVFSRQLRARSLL